MYIRVEEDQKSGIGPVGRHFNMVPGQHIWVWREKSGEGSLKSFTLTMPSHLQHPEDSVGPVLDYKKTRSTGRPAEDWEQCKKWALGDKVNGLNHSQQWWDQPYLVVTSLEPDWTRCSAAETYKDLGDITWIGGALLQCCQWDALGPSRSAITGMGGNAASTSDIGNRPQSKEDSVEHCGVWDKLQPPLESN